MPQGGAHGVSPAVPAGAGVAAPPMRSGFVSAQRYEQLIIEGIKGLPEDLLCEIADFVLFIRKRKTDPDTFQEDLYRALAGVELKSLSRDEEAHLEQEFQDYDQRYPKE
jgi:hypothetical protein